MMSSRRTRQSSATASTCSPSLSKTGTKSKSTDKRKAGGDAARKTKTKKLKVIDNTVETKSADSTKVVKFSGIVPVDSECKSCIQSYHVYVGGSDIYNAMLNQTNVGQNNNKYYLLQLLKHNDQSKYAVWFRWGRVGKIAGTNLQELSLPDAICAFEKKFKEKTKNSWSERSTFTKFPQKYDLLQIDYGENLQKEHDIAPKEVVESKLDAKVQKLMNLLFDMAEFEQSVKEMQYDIKKAPLGKLTEKQIKYGYLSMKKVELCLKKGDFGKAMQEACSEFYTRIPHDFGMKRPPLIRSPQEMKEKLQLLEALSDIKIAISIMDKVKKESMKENPLDTRYKSLNCPLSPVSESSEDYKIVKRYIENTHASTHSSYTLEIETLFEIEKPQLDHVFAKDFGNRLLLWHGSRLTNWCGILKEGLKIAPPEAPATGYMFGKGVYFADMVSKSANYCFATLRQPLGFLLLCEVALGSMCEKLNADYDADKLPRGKNSTKGLGRTVPDTLQSVTLTDGTLVPCGKPVPAVNAKTSALLYNEYIVYNVNQIRPRFLVQVRFAFSNCW